MENSKIAALVELGILCRGEDVSTHGNGAADHGPHAFSRHNQVSLYENPKYRFPFQNPEKPAYLHFDGEITVGEALDKTRFTVFLGSADSEELDRCLDKPDTIVLVFEPDDRVLVEYLDRAQLSRLNRGGVFFFTGAPYSFNPALQEMLPKELFEQGTPVFFQTERIRELYGKWATKVIEYIEILHYRHVIYPVGSQFFLRSIPFRPIKRDLMFDQQLHVYENLIAYQTCQGVMHLENALKGFPAILVAAGPDLNEKLEYIRANRNRAVIICVNNAVKPMVEAKIKPHFVVINDASTASGEVFKNIPRIHETILVGHLFSDLGGDRFRQKYLFGDYLPVLFGDKGDLELHGSVISTAFSLACLLGCDKCIFVGAQLSSPNPWGLDYAKGTMNFRDNGSLSGETSRFPHLYPVHTEQGVTSYTTLNFRDAALWLAEVIRLSGIECINTSKSSILYGQGIRYESEPELPDARVTREVADLFRTAPPEVRPDMVLPFINNEKVNWSTVRNLSAGVLQEADEVVLTRGFAALLEFDKNNISYLVERYQSFDNRYFYGKVFLEDNVARVEGLRYYFDHVRRMSDEFLMLLTRAEKGCRRLSRGVTP